MTRQLALCVFLVYVFVLVVASTTRESVATLDRAVHGKSPEREVGFGQVRFRGAGPERWAARYRRQLQVTTTLRRELAAKLSRVVYLVDAFSCVHRYEGSWDAATGNGYFGGLQMDLGFQHTYGRELLSAKGTANRWTPAEQMAVAITAYATRGFYPWPNTARRCGLIR